MLDVFNLNFHCISILILCFYFAQTKTRENSSINNFTLEFQFHSAPVQSKGLAFLSNFGKFSRETFSSFNAQTNIINNNLRKSLQSSSVVDYVSIGKQVETNIEERSRLHFVCSWGKLIQCVFCWEFLLFLPSSCGTNIQGKGREKEAF